MESDRYANISNTDESMEWYSEDFISGNLVSYLKRNGYKIHDEKVKSLPLKTEKIITVSRFFTKEVIYIKGLQPLSERKILLEVFDKKDDLTQPRNWFYESFFNSFINSAFFVSSCSNILKAARMTSLADENLPACTCRFIKVSK